jgi:hypothetical protein
LARQNQHPPVREFELGSLSKPESVAVAAAIFSGMTIGGSDPCLSSSSWSLDDSFAGPSPLLERCRFLTLLRTDAYLRVRLAFPVQPIARLHVQPELSVRSKGSLELACRASRDRLTAVDELVDRLKRVPHDLSEVVLTPAAVLKFLADQIPWGTFRDASPPCQ